MTSLSNDRMNCVARTELMLSHSRPHGPGMTVRFATYIVWVGLVRVGGSSNIDCLSMVWRQVERQFSLMLPLWTPKSFDTLDIILLSSSSKGLSCKPVQWRPHRAGTAP